MWMLYTFSFAWLTKTANLIRWFANNFENILVDWEKFEIFEFEYTSPESVFDAWKTIWENKSLNLAYTYDIEEYYEEGKFRIYISVE